MIPAGYMYKHVRPRPACGDTPRVDAFYTVSSCISEDFDYDVSTWLHNGHWFFDTVAVLDQALAAGEDSREGLSLFYYEVHDREFIRETKTWRAFETFHDMPVNVSPPVVAKLEGFDVASFWAGSSPECPGVACGTSAGDALNAYGLFDSLEAVISAFENGMFDDAEPGPLRIFSVYTVETV